MPLAVIKEKTSNKGFFSKTPTIRIKGSKISVLPKI